MAFVEHLRPYMVSSAGDVFRFDASLSEQHGASYTWTRESIEDGSSLTDHRVKNDRPLRMTIMISSAELGGVLRQRHVDEWTRLRLAADVDPPLLWEVSTVPEFYENMVIVRIGWPRTPDKGDALVGDIEFERKVFSRTDVAQNLADAAQDIGQGEVDLGSQGLG